MLRMEREVLSSWHNQAAPDQPTMKTLPSMQRKQAYSVYLSSYLQQAPVAGLFSAPASASLSLYLIID